METLFDPNGNPYFLNNTVVSSLSYSALLDINGSNIGYSNIIKNNPNNSKEIFKYTNLISNPNILNTSDYFKFYSNTSSLEHINPFGSPFGPASEDRAYQRGLLKEKILTNNSDQEVYHIWNNYSELTHTNKLETIGYKFRLAWSYATPGSNGSEFIWGANVAKYKDTNGNYKLINSIEKNVFDNGDVTLETNYEYSFTKPTLITSEEIIYDNSDVRKTVYKYPHDLVGIEQSPHMENLVSANRISEPIITESFKGAKKLSENHIKYSTSSASGNLLLPYEIHNKKGELAIDINNIEDRKIVFTKYQNGKLIEYKLENDKTISIIWGYRHTYPIAKIENATYSEVNNWLNSNYGQYTSYIQDLSDTEFSQADESNLRTWLNNLRIAAANEGSNALITTYTYAPLIGVTSVTDPKGYTTFYEYDDFNRLKMVMDANGKVLSQNKYHYKGDN